ncbi:hypothetical protein [Patulibacter minatonensis]|uniref:hypothetical protein n=1 Tax=Patulibacter minatonensis TaxID=298163 RepID=UPI0012F986B9|nr:hypothetical protein [Patulibacter minatonensis]
MSPVPRPSASGRRPAPRTVVPGLALPLVALLLAVPAGARAADPPVPATPPTTVAPGTTPAEPTATSPAVPTTTTPAVPGTTAPTPPPAGAPSPYTDGGPWFLRYPTDQLGVPGDIETGELTPNGSLFTGRLEAAFRVGTAMKPWTGGPRRLDDGGLPVYRWEGDVRGVAVRATAFAVASSGVPTVQVRLAVRNPTRKALPFGVGLDVGWLGRGLAETPKAGLLRAPFRFPRGIPSQGVGLLEQPGEPFDPTWSTSWTGNVLLRSGSPLLSARLGPGPAARAPGSTGTRVTVLRTAAPTTTPDAPTGAVRIRGTLAPGARRTIDLVVPLRTVAADHPALRDTFEAGLRRLTATWRPVLRRGMRVSTPDPDLDTAVRSGILTMLVSRYRLPDGRWVQTANKFQYQASWIRDTAMIAHSLDLLGFRQEAGEDVEFLTRWQDGSGLLESRAGQGDGMGQALWSFGDHVARSHDRALAERLLPAADAAMRWVAERLEADPRWIMPPSDPKDDQEHAPGHAAGDLAWLAGGTRRIGSIARLLDDPERAARWSQLADRVAAVAKARISEAAVAGVVPPVLDNPAGRRWGDQWIAWPTRLYSPHDPLVRATMAAAKVAEREGLALWGGRLHLYLGLRRLHTELLAGHRDDVVDGLYATLAHLTSTGGTWEQASSPNGSREVYRALGPHAWAAADLLSLVHDVLVREDGDAVRLFDAVPRSWLRPGKVAKVRGARVEQGSVDAELRATRTGATLRWNAHVPSSVPLRFRAPAGTTAVRIPGVPTGRREVVLKARSGTLRMRWRTGAAVRHAPDAASVRSALQATYARRRGR